MQIGVVFPQTELGGDVGAVRDYAQGVEGLGYRHLLAYDHVLGADPTVHTPWNGPYDSFTTFHEPFVMFGYLAAITELELVTGIIILPQRQTALVAKQAAEVDLLSEGRFRLGVGLGWNPVEYEALGQPFDQRGRRLTEQIGLLRRLWTEPTLSFDGEFDTITGAGLAPLPVQRPIPIWIGGASDAAYRRIGRLADGWFPMVRPGDDLDRALDLIRTAAEAAGRDASTLGMEGRASWSPDDPDRFARQVERWRAVGATHISIDTMYTGQGDVDEHLAALGLAAELVGIAPGWAAACGSSVAAGADGLQLGDQPGSRPALPRVRSSSGASSGTDTGGPNRRKVSSGASSGTWKLSTNPWTASRWSGSTSNGWPVALARSQLCSTSSSRATTPHTSPGSSIEPALVMPVHASGDRHAAASASSLAGIDVRQSAGRLSALAAGGRPRIASKSLRAAMAKPIENELR